MGGVLLTEELRRGSGLAERRKEMKSTGGRQLLLDPAGGRPQRPSTVLIGRPAGRAELTRTPSARLRLKSGARNHYALIAKRTVTLFVGDAGGTQRSWDPPFPTPRQQCKGEKRQTGKGLRHDWQLSKGGRGTVVLNGLHLFLD